MAFTYKATVTIDNTKVSGAANLTNFPVLILDTFDGTGGEANLKDNARSDGYDIRFYSDSGLTTALKHELVSYTTGTGALHCWVLVPTVDYDDDTVIYMAYGDAALSSDASTTDVWSDANYDLVLHLEESASDTADAYKDKSGNGYDGTGVSMAMSAPAAKVGTGSEMDGTSDYIKFGDVLDKTATETFSMSCWLKTDTQTVNQMVITKQEQGGAFDGWYIFWHTSRWINYGIIGDSTSTQLSDRNISYAQGTWYHIFITVDGSTNASGWTLIRNGSVISGVTAPVDTLTSGDDTTNAIELNVGSRDNGTLPFNGVIDEVRVHGEERTSAWAITEYNNQNAPTTFTTVGAEGPAVSTSVKDLIGSGIIPPAR